MKSILDKMGITPNAMQQDAMHALLRSDKDVVVLSPTGSGKTLAYLLPLTQLVDAGDDMPQAIVVTPGRELALQSATVLKDMGSGLRAMACYGGRMTMDEHRVMRQVRPQIIFGTPGRLNDHLDKGNLSAALAGVGMWRLAHQDCAEEHAVHVRGNAHHGERNLHHDYHLDRLCLRGNGLGKQRLQEQDFRKVCQLARVLPQQGGGALCRRSLSGRVGSGWRQV